MDTEYLTVGQFAELMGVDRSTVNDWIEDGIAPPERKLGKVVRFNKADVMTWAEGRKAA